MKRSMFAMAAAAILAAGGIASEAPAFGASPSSWEAPEPRIRDLRDRKRKKPLRAARRPAPLFVESHKASPAAVWPGQNDLRHDKYLHANARRVRQQRWALERPATPYPYSHPDYGKLPVVSP